MCRPILIVSTCTEHEKTLRLMDGHVPACQSQACQPQADLCARECRAGEHACACAAKLRISAGRPIRFAVVGVVGLGCFQACDLQYI